MKLPSRTMRSWAFVATTAVLLAVMIAPSALAANSSAAVKSGGKLTAAQPWGTIPRNFNPYAPSGANAPGTRSCIYQSLYYINAASGKETALLATKYAWTGHNLKLVVTTRSSVKWTDGKKFSAADVAFTFNYLKANPSIDLNGIWTSPLKSVTASGANTVVFTFSKPFTPAAVSILYGTDGVPTVILPKHIWSSIKNPASYTNTSPVGTGPFKLASFSTTAVIYSKNSSYFQKGRPYLSSVVFSSVDSNTTAELQLLNGTIDMSYDAMTDVKTTFVARNPSTNHYFWPVINMNYLYLNTAKGPFSNVSFRKAVASAVDTKFIANRAYFGALAGATGGAQAAIVQPQLKGWFDPSLAKYQWSFSPTKAKALLKKAGFKYSSSGKLESPAGKVFPTFSILIGGPGWTDYISLADNVSRQLSAIGITSNVVQEPYSTYANDLNKGNFDFAISWGNGNSSTPYFQYYYMFSPKQSAPIGQVANTNWGRFTSPVITKALATYAGSSNRATQKKAISAIAKEVLTKVPVVPLTGRANWLVYQTRTLTGFPSKSNPYNDGSASDQEGAMLVYLNAHQK
jgi:peptide/nickel transport system substrate-binding protein